MGRSLDSLSHKEAKQGLPAPQLVRASSASTKTQGKQLSQKEEKFASMNSGIQHSVPQVGLSPSFICISHNVDFILPVLGFWENEILVTGNSGLYLNKSVPKKKKG